jgi:hypothetical protein
MLIDGCEDKNKPVNISSDRQTERQRATADSGHCRARKVFGLDAVRIDGSEDRRQQIPNTKKQTTDTGHQEADSRQHTADSRQHTADSNQQTADSRQQTV